MGEFISFSSQAGTKTRDHFLEMSQKANMDGANFDFAMPDIVAHFATSPYLEDMSTFYWAWNNFDFNCHPSQRRNKHQWPKRVVFSISSEVRPKLVPLFGHQDNLEFVRLTAEKIKQLPDDLADIPDHLILDLVSYWDRFPLLSSRQRVQFQLAILAKLIEHPRIKYLSHAIEKGKFIVSFVNQTKSGPIYRISFVADFLPILLDVSAFDLALPALKP